MASKKWLKKDYLTIYIAIAFLILATIVAVDFVRTEQTVEVQGTYTLTAPPEKAVFDVSAEVTADTAEEAQDLAAESVNGAKADLIAAGVPEDAFSTVRYDVWPNYDYDEGREITGYTATHTLEVEITDLENIGTYLDTAVSGGFNRVSSVRFELEDDTQASIKAEALAKASEDARTKADGIAEGLGMKVKKVVRVTDQTFDYGPVFRTMEAVAIAGAEPVPQTDIEPEDIEVRAQVSATFALGTSCFGS